MVHPAHRRRGIGARLLDGVLTLSTAAGRARAAVHRPPGGRRRAGARRPPRRATLHHSEHALELRGEPVDGPGDPRLTMRAAERRDVPAIMALMEASGFGFAPPDTAERLAEEGVRSLVFERDGAVVGTLRAAFTGETAGVYGFAVHPRLRGRGIGRARCAGPVRNCASAARGRSPSRSRSTTTGRCGSTPGSASSR